MDDIQVNDKITIPASEIEFSYSRSPGPGGQNVNKVNSKATLKWDITRSESVPESVRARFIELFGTRVNNEGHLVLYSSKYRDAPRNADDCIEKLSDMLRSAAVKPKRRIPTRRTRASQRRRLDSKRQQSEKKQSRRESRDY